MSGVDDHDYVLDAMQYPVKQAVQKERERCLALCERRLCHAQAELDKIQSLGSGRVRQELASTTGAVFRSVEALKQEIRDGVELPLHSIGP